MNHPNILFILTDQQRFDTLSAYGCKVIDTPNLDRLAREGIRFNNCYVNNPICTPSRASIWTGKALPGHGVYRLHDILPESETLFPKYLKEKNYQTGLFGKLHVSGRSHEGKNRHSRDGFDYYKCSISPYVLDGEYKAYSEWLQKRNPDLWNHIKIHTTKSGYIPAKYHFTRWAMESASEFMVASKRSEPFFCCISLFDPHDPYDDHPEEMLEQINEDELIKMFKGRDQPDSSLNSIQREHEGGLLGNVGHLSKEQILKIRRSYFASIAFMDQEIGELLNVLEQNHLMENTLIVFLSDHGDMIGEKGLLGKGAYFYDPCTRVPLLIRPPGGVLEGTVSNFLAQPTDIASTFLETAGFSKEWVDERYPDSRNLLKVTEEGSNKRPFAICMYRNSGINHKKVYWEPPINATMLRNSRYKLNIYHNERNDGKHCSGQLFDMQEDPGETKNLWNEPTMKSVIADLLLDLNNWFVEQDCRSNMSKGGSQFPPVSEWAINIPIKT